jgi:F-type H+-transporting ATPase subunit epsilon
VDPKSSNRLQCIVVTPEKAVLDQPADMVVLPMFDGELGVLPGRAPMIGRLGHGELRLQIPIGGVSVAQAGTTGELKEVPSERIVRYYVDGGFAQIRSNVVTVLTQKAIPAKDLQTDAAAQQLRDAMGKSAHSPEEQAARQAAEDRARAQLRIAKKT